MKNEKIVNAYNNIQPGGEVRERVLDRVAQRQHNKRHICRTAIPFAAVAAVICLVVLGGIFLTPQSENVNFFSLKAYALEQQPDGSIEMREADLLGDTYYWTTFNDGSVFYLNANLKCEGENISSVVFFADNGFFAKQYLRTENGIIIQEEGVPASYSKAPGDIDYTLVMYGHEFDVVGDSFSLDSGPVADDYLLFVGVEVSDWREPPPQITIRATATFNDGKTQEETIVLDLANAGLGTGVVVYPPEELERRQAENEKRLNALYSIPLEQCVVVPGSVQFLNFGDTFTYSNEFVIAAPGDIVSTAAMYPVTEESISSAMAQGLFDEIGIFRLGSNLPDDGSDGYIAVIENNLDGTFTGMVYVVPSQLILEYMK